MKWFTADTHFGKTDSRVSDSGEIKSKTMNRPFSSCLDMTLYMIEKINEKVEKNDELWILGDFAWDVPGRWLQSIRCNHKYLIFGNHDGSWEKSLAVFGQHKVWQIHDVKIKNHPTTLCHYPMLYWNKSHYGSFCLGGHVHDMRTETILGAFPDIRWLDVGIDSAKRILGDYIPFNENDIYDILSKRKGHDDVNFYEKLRGSYLLKDQKIVINGGQ